MIEKLEVDGPALQSTHQSGVRGEEGSGFGPEAEIDKAGYAKVVRLAKQRLKRLEKAKEKE